MSANNPLIQETVEDKKFYEGEKAEAREFFNSNLTADVGFWELVVYPTTYNSDLIQNPVESMLEDWQKKLLKRDG